MAKVTKSQALGALAGIGIAITAFAVPTLMKRSEPSAPGPRLLSSETDVVPLRDGSASRALYQAFVPDIDESITAYLVDAQGREVALRGTGRDDVRWFEAVDYPPNMNQPRFVLRRRNLGKLGEPDQITDLLDVPVPSLPKPKSSIPMVVAVDPDPKIARSFQRRTSPAGTFWTPEWLGPSGGQFVALRLSSGVPNDPNPQRDPSSDETPPGAFLEALETIRVTIPREEVVKVPVEIRKTSNGYELAFPEEVSVRLPSSAMYTVPRQQREFPESPPERRQVTLTYGETPGQMPLIVLAKWLTTPGWSSTQIDLVSPRLEDLGLARIRIDNTDLTAKVAKVGPVAVGRHELKLRFRSSRTINLPRRRFRMLSPGRPKITQDLVSIQNPRGRGPVAATQRAK